MSKFELHWVQESAQRSFGGAQQSSAELSHLRQQLTEAQAQADDAFEENSTLRREVEALHRSVGFRTSGAGHRPASKLCVSCLNLYVASAFEHFKTMSHGFLKA